MPISAQQVLEAAELTNCQIGKGLGSVVMQTVTDFARLQKVGTATAIFTTCFAVLCDFD